MFLIRFEFCSFPLLIRLFFKLELLVLNTTKKSLCTLIAFILVLMAALPALSENQNSLTVSARNYFEPGETLVTPHEPWLKPYSGGEVKALFVVPRSGMREVVELAQRMHLNYTVFPTYNESTLEIHRRTSQWVPGESEEEMLSRMRTYLQEDYDVIVFGGVHWTLLPLSVRVEILRQVRGGAGLVGILPERDAPVDRIMGMKINEEEMEAISLLLSGVPGSAIIRDLNPEANLAEASLETAMFGSGRIALYRFSPGAGFARAAVGYQHVLTPGPAVAEEIGRSRNYEYQMAFNIKTILWAAGREPDILLAPEKQFNSFCMESAGVMAVRFVLENPGGDKSVSANMRLFSSEGRELAEKNQRLNMGRGPAELVWELPSLPAGSYYVDAVVRETESRAGFGAVINFATASVNIESLARIQSIEFGKDVHETGEAVYGSITLKKPGRSDTLRLRHYDNWGRLIEDFELAVEGDRVPFRLKNAGALTVLQALEVSLIEKENVIHSVSEEFNVKIPAAPRDEMRVFLWMEMSDPPPFYMLPVLEHYRRAGVDTRYHVPSPALNVIARANMRQASILARIAPREEENMVRIPCLTTSGYRDSLARGMAGRVNFSSLYSVDEFSQGNENRLGRGELCFSETCREDFRRFVRKRYGNIETLNRAYSTEYGSFSEVEPVTLEEAQRTGDIVRWVDQRTQMEDVWSGIYEFGRETVSATRPDASYGYEGSDNNISSQRASNFWKLSRAMDLNCLYYSPFMAAMWRSFLPDDALFGAGWLGGYSAPFDAKISYAASYFPWLNLIKGANSLWVWHAYPGAGSVTAPDYAFYDYFEDSLERIREIKSGIDKALLSSERLTDVGIFYSPSSVHVREFLNLGVGTTDHYQGISQILTDIGFQPRVYAYEEVADGVLIDELPEALFLIGAISLSEQQARALRDYVRAGGILVADVQPGVRDERGSPLDEGLLNELFGVSMLAADALERVESPGFDFVSTEEAVLPFVLTDPGVSLAGAEAIRMLGAAPVFISKSYGEGYAVLLNFTLEDYGALRREWPRSSGHRDIVRNVLDSAGVRPGVVLEEPVAGLETALFDGGGVLYAVFLRDIPSLFRQQWMDYVATEITEMKNTVRVNANLPVQGHLYDVRGGAYLGFGDSVELELTSIDPAVIAVVPYRIEGVEIKTSSRATRGEPAECGISILIRETASPSPQAVRVSVFAPDGTEIEPYGKKLVVEGSVLMKIPFALNDAPGRWRISAVDVISGIETERHIVLQ